MYQIRIGTGNDTVDIELSKVTDKLVRLKIGNPVAGKFVAINLDHNTLKWLAAASDNSAAEVAQGIILPPRWREN